MDNKAVVGRTQIRWRVSPGDSSGVAWERFAPDIRRAIEQAYASVNAQCSAHEVRITVEDLLIGIGGDEKPDGSGLKCVEYRDTFIRGVGTGLLLG